jgi:hypothetical protein
MRIGIATTIFLPLRLKGIKAETIFRLTAIGGSIRFDVLFLLSIV